MRVVALPIALLLSACGGDDGGGQTCATINPSQAPSDDGPLFTFLGCKLYEAWPKETAAHATTGPHGSTVRVFVNPTLEGSLMSGAADHPAGSTAVKEIFGGDGALRGWAVMVKVDGTGGDAWYWYENLSTSSNSPVAASRGASLCAGCHGAGRDFFRTGFPLQ
jgi:hypothetical protein